VLLLLAATSCTRRAEAPASSAPSEAPPSAGVETPLRPELTALQAVRAEVPAYTVSPSLTEVVNLAAFQKIVPVTAEQRALLAKNLFVCVPTRAEQLFYIYENNDYLNLPSFVTVDTVLQVYHIFYDFTLRTVEAEALSPALKRLTEGMLQASVETWQQAQDPKLKAAALKNVAYFGVAAHALALSRKLPPEADAMVRRERALMDAHASFTTGAIFPYRIDYSQFIPRGHYTRSDALKQFFRAMMWYGLAPFAPRYQSGGTLVRADEPVRQGLLLVQALYRTGLDEEWARVYEPTAFYVGAADDLTPAEWKAISDRVFGKEAPPTAFTDSARFEAFVAALDQARPARIRHRVVLQDQVADPAVQLRFMGQRYLPDSEVLQRLSEPTESGTSGRPFPSGLDVMAVLGSARAAGIADAHPEIYNAGKWSEYLPERARLAGEFARLPAETWTSNLYWSWLHALQALLEPVPEGFPSFMRNEAWQEKSLHTAQASWAELRHDTILYGKQSAVECGNGEQPFVKGYVEPNVVLYSRLLQLTRQSREGLDRRRLLSDRLKDRFEQFEDMLALLKTISEKELRGEKLTEQEYEEIRYFGGKLEYLTLSVMSGSPSHWELVSETDRNMAVVADVHTDALSGRVLEEGVGHAYELLAIVPIEGRPTLTRGAVFSYYEFKHPMGDRLTDEKWQGLLKDGRAPDPPVWVKSFLAPGTPRRLKSSELEVYTSGC
jgi:hypothetical protein